MKKQLSMSLAAAMAFGAVVPAFANETVISKEETVDVRLAHGKEIYNEEGKEVFTRDEIFNYNGADVNDRDKHTLKSEYQNLEILVQKEDETDANNDLFVLSKKTDDNIGFETNKAKYDAILAEINSLLDEGYEMERATTNATITTESYVTGSETLTLTKGTDIQKISYTNVDMLEKVTIDEVEKLRNDIFGDIIAEIESLTTSSSITVTDNNIGVDFGLTKNTNEEIYRVTNVLKYTIENNTDKFDIVVDESGENNSGRLVKLYAKGALKEDRNLVMNINFANIANVDETKVIDMPLVSESDFNGHWAEDTIVDAMINGYVDASNNFRPKDSVTRAEFSKMVCTIFGIDTENLEHVSEPFHDVESGKWYYEYIVALYNFGGEKGAIIDGYEDSTFKPNDTITRQEAAKMVAQAFLMKGGELTLQESVDEKGNVSLVTTTSTITKAEETMTVNGEIIHLDSTTSFNDDADIKSWADASVENLKNIGIVNGYDGNEFKPQNTITRVEALLMLTRGQDLLK